VQVGQKASFTVSAYPSRKYPAKVTRVAYGATKTDNVITYTTYLEVDNSDLSLRPGMTAAATITSTERTAVLLVPNTALRFSPAPAAGAGPAASGGFASRLFLRMGRSAAPKVAGVSDAAGVRQVWLLKDGEAVPVAVRTGISDGRMTEVSGDEVKEGAAVITDQRSTAR
jgi:HlyD family secretion protein